MFIFRQNSWRNAEELLEFYHKKNLIQHQSIIWLNFFYSYRYSTAISLQYREKEQHSTRLLQIVGYLIWTLLASWATHSTSEKELQQKASEEPPCSVFLSLLVKRQQVSQSLLPGENVQVSLAYKPHVFLQTLQRDLYARRFPHVSLTSGKITSLSVSKNSSCLIWEAWHQILIVSSRDCDLLQSIPTAVLWHRYLRW